MDTNSKNAQIQEMGRDRLASRAKFLLRAWEKLSELEFELIPDDPVRDHTDEIIPNLQLAQELLQEVCHPPDKGGSIADVGPLMVSVEDMLHDSLEQLLNADNWMLARWEACKREETKVGAQEMKEDPEALPF